MANQTNTVQELNSSRNDLGYLKALFICHYVFCGLIMLGLVFLLLHYLIMKSVFDNPALWTNVKNQSAPLPNFFSFFIWFYLFFGSMIITAAVLNLLSALFIQKRKNRIFSIVVAGIDCIQFPFGTLLGVFTIIVLAKESVKQLYQPEGGNRHPHP